jgi:hypothetical protein
MGSLRSLQCKKCSKTVFFAFFLTKRAKPDKLLEFGGHTRGTDVFLCDEPCGANKVSHVVSKKEPRGTKKRAIWHVAFSYKFWYFNITMSRKADLLGKYTPPRIFRDI